MQSGNGLLLGAINPFFYEAAISFLIYNILLNKMSKSALPKHPTQKRRARGKWFGPASSFLL